MNERTGIAVAGTLLVDKLYEIDAYPAAGELTKIKSMSLSVGGLVPNNGIGLKRIDPQISIFAIGRVGRPMTKRSHLMINTITKKRSMSFSKQQAEAKTAILSLSTTDQMAGG